MRNAGQLKLVAVDMLYRNNKTIHVQLSYGYAHRASRAAVRRNYCTYVDYSNASSARSRRHGP